MSTDLRRSLNKFAAEMKRDWDWRARENAKWFINTFKLEQSDEEFYATGRRDFEGVIQRDLALLTWGRDPRSLRLLEIGCGIGRMTRYLAETFGEIHAVDVSAEMIRLARERFQTCQHVHFYATSGVDFSEFPDDHFDLIISAYVFQHVPDQEVIAANLRDAFRVLKPGGMFKFATNGITHPDFESMPKDTWAGVTFSGDEVRLLARKIGAQLLGITGEGTQYCWSLMRKRLPQSGPSSAHPLSPHILFCGRPDNPGIVELPARTGDTYLTSVVAGLDYEEVDITNLMVALDERSLLPCYVGPVGSGIREILQLEENPSGGKFVQVNLRVPDDEPGGTPAVRVRLASGATSNPVSVILPPPQMAVPVIQLVTNVPDGGTDISARGPKSRIRLFVAGLKNSAEPGDIGVLVAGCRISPERVVFLPGNAVWEITIQLPEAILPGQIEMEIISGALKSSAHVVTVQ
jgi:SAM-dependent methyltransferase